jgi:polyhydroxybutyrate depolymerase
VIGRGRTILRRAFAALILAAVLAIPLRIAVAQQPPQQQPTPDQQKGAAVLFGHALTPHQIVPLVLTTLQTPGGQARSYIVHRPPGSGPQPTIILLHGDGSSAEPAARNSGVAQMGLKAGFLSVFPDGTAIMPGSMQHGWNYLPSDAAANAYTVTQLEGFALPAKAAIPDDVEFLTALVDDLVQRGLSDPKRIYLAGISAGGFMALRMVCAHAELFAGVAVIVSGMPEELGAQCRPSKPIPALVIKGTADPRVPYDGGPVSFGAFSVWPQEKLVDFFRKLDGCGDTPEPMVLPRLGPFQVESLSYQSCTAGARVQFYRVVNGVHAVPSVPAMALALWTFFNEQPGAPAASPDKPEAPPPSRP